MNNKCSGCEASFDGAGPLCPDCHASAKKQVHLLTGIIVSVLAISVYRLTLSSPVLSSQAAPPREPSMAALEEQLQWDEATRPYRDSIVTGLDRLARTDTRCSRVEPASLSLISRSGGVLQGPVFEITCTGGARSVALMFTSTDSLPELPRQE